MDETELIQRLKKGDEEAMSEIMKIYKNRIFNFILRYVKDREKALDLTQEVFIKAYFKIDSFKMDCKFSTWLFTIATNLSRSELRKRKIVEMLPFSSLKLSSENHPGNSNCLEFFLNQLKPDYRIPLILKEIEGFSTEEISRILKIPEGTVKSRLFRAKETLRDLIKKE
ncbi:MAG: RNA polymerase sigma factor [Candidatus Aminicenantia bacterium]